MGFVGKIAKTTENPAIKYKSLKHSGLYLIFHRFSILFIDLITIHEVLPDYIKAMPNSVLTAGCHTISLKTPGNPAVDHPLTPRPGNGRFLLEAERRLPVSIVATETPHDEGSTVEICITALKEVWFQYSQAFDTEFAHDECQFLMPGFWYRQNLRSPKEAPSFHTSDSWTVREDRLSTPLTGIFDPASGKYHTVLRVCGAGCDALTTHKSGEVMLSGNTSIGFTGFENIAGRAALRFGFPYQETPYCYISKLTLAPPVRAYQHLPEGTTIILRWELRHGTAADFSEFVRNTWEYSYDSLLPEAPEPAYSDERMKEALTGYFTAAYVDSYPLKYMSGEQLRTADCEPNGRAEVGFVGRVLLNAFNALEYGYEHGRTDLIDIAKQTFDSYERNGFSAGGFIREFVDFKRGTETDVFSIRRQSEGIYALLHYLHYEKKHGRKHPGLERKITSILNAFLQLQADDGSFPRKFHDDRTTVDASGGSTPSATLPLVMAYRYFGDKRYLAAAEKTARYLESEIIDKADYFSSTLDANCEDKEASLYAATAMYYLALAGDRESRSHYAALARKAAYFALSWYYLWDVPFAPGQMLGDLGLKTRGWGNVSVENNHIDVFVFEFCSVLDWLGREFGERRFSDFAQVIENSMRQLLPTEERLCGIAKPGYYPEVVQHTNWDYGKNGKGFYNDIFAPGWTVASLWEMLTPGHAERFLNRK